MVRTEEENFPRGGKINLPLKRLKHDDNLFEYEKLGKLKKVKRSRRFRKENVYDEIFDVSNVKGKLTYSKLQDDMVILGCVRCVTDFSVEAELPNLTFGSISIANISDCFTDYLNRRIENSKEKGDITLKTMFTPGQFVLLKVLSIENNEKGKYVKCTMNPREINHEKSHDSFKKGMLAWACVQSVLDHGYEINIGVKNCRVFLPLKNVEDGKSLVIGEPLWCTIHKSESTDSVTTLRVSSKAQHIRGGKIEEIDRLQHIIPGMQVEILVDKITSYGIQGKVLNDYFGYIDETQLKETKKLNDYKEGKLLTAFVLYIEPATKIIHLTLRNLEPVLPPFYQTGDIISAEVISKAFNGLYLELPNNEKCFITHKRIINSLPKKSNLDVSNAIKTKFPIGSKHTCRILDYSRMSRLYICSSEQSLVKEKLFSSKDFKIGQEVTVTVEVVKVEGLVVATGHVRGFVPNLHISNVEYSANLKKKFKEGDTVTARVLDVKDGNIIFTLKPSLVESEKCLFETTQVKRGDQYPGVVVQSKPTGVSVAFYGDVLGWISKNNVGNTKNIKAADSSQYFFRGQVVNPWVLGIKRKKVILTLKKPSALKTPENLRIGQRIKGVVGRIHKDRIDIKSARGREIGRIPVNHLSCTTSLSSVFLKIYKPGDEIKDLICIYNKDNFTILSRREALVFNGVKKNKLMKFKDIKVGTLLRCSYLSSCETGIYILPLILDYNEKILVENKDIIGIGESLPRFKYHQSIIAKVLNINQESQKIHATIKFKEVFDNKVETTIRFFSQHLTDIKYLRSFGYENDWKICQYQPGERVSCKIEQLGDKGGCLVTLPNDVQGLVSPRLCPANLGPGQLVEGVFLSQDFKDNYAELCLNTHISQKINKHQDGIINTSSVSSCFAETILVKNDSIIGVLRQENCHRQLVYIPLYLHENDNKGCQNYYENSKFKICICGKVGDYLIGMSKKLFMTLDKQKVSVKKQKLQSSNKKSIDLAKNKSVLKSEQLKSNLQSDDDTLSSQTSELEIINVKEHDEIENSDEEHEYSEQEQKKLKKNDATEDNSNEDSTVSGENISGVKRKRSKKNINFGSKSFKEFDTNDSITGPLPVLPGVSLFFNSNTNNDDSSTSDEEEEVEIAKKKKKLTPAERIELARQEEERISTIEKELVDLTNSPKSAEQFDRLLMANPNSSELWTKYMSFHVGATEFDKARAVAKRALESIDVTLTEERLNIWLALLNLENMLGSKESFEKTFEEAVKYNDSLRVYLKAIEILADTNKFSEMEEKIKKVKNKYRYEVIMWIEVAKILYSKNKLKEARNFKDTALKSIQDKKIQLNLIVRFAIFEFRYGEEEQGAAIFETILSSDPKKVSIWTTYVDQLVKKERIDQARRVLERSVCQRLPLKCMKILFLKFRMFEEKHGTPDSVEAVKEKAKEYVAKVTEK